MHAQIYVQLSQRLLAGASIRSITQYTLTGIYNSIVSSTHSPFIEQSGRHKRFLQSERKYIKSARFSRRRELNGSRMSFKFLSML
jgi:hypothetical protein